MKRLLLSVLLLVPGMAFAIDPASIVRSSFTKTNDTAVCFAASYMTEVLVSSVGVAGSNLALYNSTWTTAGQFASVTGGTIFDWDFKDLAVKGICYTTTNNGNSGGITILYRK